MARDFDPTNTEYLHSSTVSITMPFAIVIWARGDDNSADYAFFSSSTLTRYYNLRRDVSPDRVIWYFRDDSDNAGNCLKAGVYAENAWTHLCGILTTASQRVLIDGANKATASVALSETNYAQNTWIGQYKGGDYMRGMLAEAAIYDLSVYPGATDSDKADNWEAGVLPALADGFSPLCYPI